MILEQSRPPSAGNPDRVFGWGEVPVPSRQTGSAKANLPSHPHQVDGDALPIASFLCTVAKPQHDLKRTPLFDMNRGAGGAVVIIENLRGD